MRGKRLTLLISILLFSSLASAEDLHFFYPQTLDLSADVRNWDYKEYRDGAVLMRDYGMLYGVSGDFRYIFESNEWMFHSNISAVFGDTKYDGQLQDGTPYFSDSRNRITTWTFNFLRAYPFTNGMFTMQWGLGLQKLTNEELPEEPADYTREISYTYVPFGMSLYTVLSPEFKIRFTIIYNLFLSGRVKTYLMDFGYSNNIENDQNKGKGIRSEIAFWGHGWKILFYMNYWRIEDSTVGLAYDPDGDLSGFLEPENQTRSYGVTVGVSF